MYYSSIGILSIIMHVIINAEVLFNKTAFEQTAVGKAYRRFLFAVTLYYFSDALWGVLMDLKIIPVVYADTVIYFLAMGLTVLFWTKYIAAFLELNKRWTKILSGIGWFVFGSEALSLIVNFFVPIMFYFKADCEYVASSARYIILYIQVILFVLIAIDTLAMARKSKTPASTHCLAIGISGLIMALLIYLQAQFPLMPFYAIGCLLATSIIHTFVVVAAKVEQTQKLNAVTTVAYKDPLTSVRNVNAYTEYKDKIDDDISNGRISEFAVAVFDLNDLKCVNDTQGHEAGDKYIQDGCYLICHIFRHSPVFRIGGDEFAAFLINDDYQNRESLINTFNEQVEQNLEEGKVVVSVGISLYNPAEDAGYDEVFARADVLMYERKKDLKSRRPAAV